MRKINPTKPRKTQQNSHKTTICEKIYDWGGVSWDCGQLTLSLLAKLV
jgi:hypothetical protein